MKILWHSNAPWSPSGYGQQTAIFAPKMAEDGHDVAISAFFGLSGAMSQWGGLPVYPRFADRFGNDSVTLWADRHFGGDKLAGLIVTLIDVWVLKAPELPSFPVASWVPVDHTPVSQPVRGYFDRVGATPLAMSRFGERELGRAGIESIYIPHGVDMRTFQPGDRAAAREALGLPSDAFVVFSNLANQDRTRKAKIEQLRAFAQFRQRHPDAVLLMHTLMSDEMGGLDQYRLVDELDLPKGSVVWTDQVSYKLGMPVEYLVAAYNAADVTLNATAGEGFGIPIIESQACGTPVIATDHTAMPELVGSGWLVEGEPLWQPDYEAWWKRPNVDEIAGALESARNASATRRREAREFAEGYDAETVYRDHWKPALQLIERALVERREEVA